MFSKDQIIVGLEVGTSKVCAVVAEVLEDGTLMIIGIGQGPSAGVRKGEIIDMEAAAESIRAAVAEAEESETTTTITLGDHEYLALGGVLRSAGGTPLGGFALLRDRDSEFALFRALQRTILISGLVALAFAGLFSWLVAGWVTRPVAKLAEATRRASDGDYNAEITADSPDEIGALATAFRRLLADLREKQQLVEFLSAASNEAKTVQMPSLSGTVGRQIAQQGITPGGLFANRYEVKEMLGQIGRAHV